jgi:hypothetical protein
MDAECERRLLELMASELNEYVSASLAMTLVA